MTHKQRMIERRQRQLAREPGFTPVLNRRVAGAMQQAFLLFQMRGMTAPEAESAARDHVAKSLPKLRASKLYRYRPSKSDSAIYRKAIA